MPERPNIILIMTDQQRFDTLGAWGYDYAITPAMDRLAAEGLSFRNAFCPGATCIASRAAIFTGMYPHNTGVYSFDHWADHRNWVQDLNDAGYHCVNIGKMHFAPRDVAGGFHERVVVENPTSKHLDLGGADDDWGRYLRIHGLERPNDRNKTDPNWLRKYQGVPWHLEERFHSDVFIGDSALAWIRDYKGQQPFFLQVGFTGPHEPWDPLPRHLEQYAGRPMPPRVLREGELEDKPPQHAAQRKMHAETEHESAIDMYSPSEEDIARMRRHYYAKITTVDEQLGEVLDALQTRGFLDHSPADFLLGSRRAVGRSRAGVQMADVRPRGTRAADCARQSSDAKGRCGRRLGFADGFGADDPRSGWRGGAQLLRGALAATILGGTGRGFCSARVGILRGQLSGDDAWPAAQNGLLHRPRSGRAIRLRAGSARTVEPLGPSRAAGTAKRAYGPSVALARREHVLQCWLPPPAQPAVRDALATPGRRVFTRGAGTAGAAFV